MTFEEHFEYHEQWLRSMESNQQKLSEDLQRLADAQKTLTGDVQTLTGDVRKLADGQQKYNEALVGLIAYIASVASSVKSNEEHIRRLEQVFEQYLRSRSNGSQAH